MKKRAVIFDMDGTLFDTEPLSFLSWKRLVELGRVDASVLEMFPAMIGKNRATINKMLTDAYGEDFPLEETARLRSVLTKEELDRNGVPMKHFAAQILAALQERGYKLALATSTSAASVEDYMQRTRFDAYLHAIVTGDRVKNSKPAPDIFLLAAERLGVKPEECFVLEDSHNGVRAGHAAGMTVIMVPDLQEVTEEMRRLSAHICKTLEDALHWIDETNR